MLEWGFTPEEIAKIRAIQERFERTCPGLDPAAVEQALTPYEHTRRTLTPPEFERLYARAWDGKKPTMPPPGMPPKGKGKGKGKPKGKGGY